jgi:hypothetical protein
MRTFSSWKSLEAPYENRLLETLTAQQLFSVARMSTTQLREIHSRAEFWFANFEDLYNSIFSSIVCMTVDECLCLVPLDTRVKEIDLVCILFGGQTLFIFRK